MIFVSLTDVCPSVRGSIRSFERKVARQVPNMADQSDQPRGLLSVAMRNSGPKNDFLFIEEAYH